MTMVLDRPGYIANIEPEHANHYLACPRHPVAKLLHILPGKYLTQLQNNEKLADCCRDAVKHDIEAWYSSAADRDKGIPDIYIMYCTCCEREHRRFCVGGSTRPPLAVERGSKRDETPEEYAAMLKDSKRPFWEIR